MLQKIHKEFITYRSPLPKAEATWWVTLDRLAIPIKLAVEVVTCLYSDSRISRAATWPSCARRTVGMPTEHRSWTVAPWYYLQPKFPKSNPFKYRLGNTCNFQIICNFDENGRIYQKCKIFSREDLLRFKQENHHPTLHLRFLLGWLRIELQNVMDVKTCASGHLEALQNSTTERSSKRND